MKLSSFLSLILVAGFLAGCATDQSPVDRRIEKNSAMFGQLSEDEKRLVTAGRIKEGMRMDAVYLSWGPADNITHGEKDGKLVETWYYGTRDPYAYSPYWNVGVGRGYGGGFGSFGFGTGPGRYYGSSLYARDFYYNRSFPTKWVSFHENRVVQWEAETP